ncbi:MAG TPA: Lrp/AsnC family transcriptional regulator [Thermoplasmata archaeon]|nr:Lrp/AsnC family transcriptional regulator [Thermoplasmata archaeon]
MDENDEKIIAILKENAREPFVKIAGKLKLSEGAIRNRVGKLVREGVIRRFTIETGEQRIKALIAARIRVNSLAQEAARKIRTLEGVERVYEVSGDEDLIAVVEVAKTEDLNATVDRIRRMESTLSTRTLLVMKEH